MARPVGQGVTGRHENVVLILTFTRAPLGPQLLLLGPILTVKQHSKCHTAPLNIFGLFLFLTKAKVVVEDYGLEPAANLSV